MFSHTVPKRLLEEFTYFDPVTQSQRLWRYEFARPPYPRVSPSKATGIEGHFADPEDEAKERQLEMELAGKFEHPVNEFLFRLEDADLSAGTEKRKQLTFYVTLLFNRSAARRRASMGGKRSESIIAGLRNRLHEGMAANGYDAAMQEEVMRVLSTVREFMFPESHAHSFASIAYSSAYTRFHFPAAYTCALFNNQPMGFYSPATIANDAKRHGVKMLPIDVQKSDWFCMLEEMAEQDRKLYAGAFAVRMGLRYVKGLRQMSGDEIADARALDGPFASEYDLRRRVASIKKSEMVLLAEAGAFNWIGTKHHRRAALWHAERAGQSAGPLFENVPDLHEQVTIVPLQAMTTEERLVADFDSTGLTLGPHPMAYHRQEMNRLGVVPAAHLKSSRDGVYTSIAGAVIARQRPGTAEGFIFLSLEDETGISNAIINPRLYERNRVAVTHGKFLHVEGMLQNRDGVINVRASAVHVLELSDLSMRSHDFR